MVIVKIKLSMDILLAHCLCTVKSSSIPMCVLITSVYHFILYGSLIVTQSLKTTLKKETGEVTV